MRLKEYGSESFEVIDNGSGVEEKNFEALSKLTFFKFQISSQVRVCNAFVGEVINTWQLFSFTVAEPGGV